MSDNGKPHGNGFAYPELVRSYRKDFLYSLAIIHGAPFKVLMSLMDASSEGEEAQIMAEVKAGKHKWYNNI